MDNEAFEIEEKFGNGRLKGNGNVISGAAPGDGNPVAPLAGVPSEVRVAEEISRYDQVRDVAETGNGLKMEELLGEWEKRGWLRDWRNEENLTLYADAITDNYLDVINVLLQFDIPLGDALMRAIDVEFDDAIKAICRYLETREDMCDQVLKGHSDNDDFHPAITPLILAAQRNSFGTVQLLMELGAEIEEPSLSQGGDVTLTQAISSLHVYRALSQPAYILATQTDVFGHAFELSAKLRVLSRTWEDFGQEYEQMARGVEVLAGEMLGQSASTEEILALFRYHTTDKYRDAEGKQHPLSKMFEAIKYQQKEFIAHPHSQKAFIAQFYRNALDWNERGFWYQILLPLLILLGYPIICLLYIFIPVRKVVNFARLPYIQLLMRTASDFTFLAFVTALAVLSENTYPRATQALYALVLIWVIGLAWSHMKVIMKHGLSEYLSGGSINLNEVIMIAMYLTVFFLHWNGRIDVTPNYVFRRSAGHDAHDTHGTHGTLDTHDTHDTPFTPFTTHAPGTHHSHNIPTSPSFADLQIHVASVLSSLGENLTDSVFESVNGALVRALSDCRLVGPTPAGESGSTSEAPSPSLPQVLQETIDYDQYEPVVVARALFGVTIVVSFLRLMNLFLMSDSIGPLRISLGSMVDDIIKFFCLYVVIWFAFAIGLGKTFYSAGQSATRACIDSGEDISNCRFQTGFSTFFQSIADLYWSLFGITELDVLELPPQHFLAEGVGTIMFVFYHIIAVVILLNALIGMLSNTYNRTEKHADTEWKFHRAAVWATYLRPAGTLPPPFNLIPSVKSLFRFVRYIIGIWVRRVRRKVINRKMIHSKKEFGDYMRVLKLTRSRYIQANLSTTSQSAEEVRPRDIQSLRNDVQTFRFFAQDRLKVLIKTLTASIEKSADLRHKLNDLNPLTEKTSEVFDTAVELTEKVSDLRQETDHLDEEQTTEIIDRDTEASGLRKRIVALQADMERLNSRHSAKVAAMESDHSAKLSERDRQETGLNDTISTLRAERSSLEDRLRGILDDKDELLSTVDELCRKIDKITSLQQEREQESERSTPKQIGFFRRFASKVEETLNGNGDKAGTGQADGKLTKSTEKVPNVNDNTESQRRRRKMDRETKLQASLGLPTEPGVEEGPAEPVQEQEPAQEVEPGLLSEKEPEEKQEPEEEPKPEPPKLLHSEPESDRGPKQDQEPLPDEESTEETAQKQGLEEQPRSELQEPGQQTDTDEEPVIFHF